MKNTHKRNVYLKMRGRVGGWAGARGDDLRADVRLEPAGGDEAGTLVGASETAAGPPPNTFGQMSCRVHPFRRRISEVSQQEIVFRIYY